MNEELHITSLVVHAAPADLAQVGEAIAALPGAQVHGVNETGGKLVITLEAPTSHAIMDQVTLIQQTRGVIVVTMVYQHAESLESLNTEIHHVDPS